MPNVSTVRAAADAPADDIGLEDIVSFDAFHKQFPNIANESRLRWWIFHRKSNGLEASGAIIKRAGRWFVVMPRLRNWILSGAGSQAAA
ncbi:MAG: hypothetical protein MUF80_07760 [Burkholderiales bacterium]|jgi:hypothetical protein|nr:hypothetical protein [Burkholderiales bacterium]